MRIKKLEMNNFRGFDELTVEFPEKGSAVFVGVNGAGKTSVLECISILLKVLVVKTNKFKFYPFLSQKDIQLGKSSTVNQMDIEFEGNINSIEVKFPTKNNNNENEQLEQPNSNLIKRLYENVSENEKSSIPFFVLYPTDRNVEKEFSLESKNILDEDQFTSFAFPYNIDFKAFFQWFRNMEDIENEQIRFNSDINFRQKGLEAVRQAIKSFLPNFSNPRVQRQPQEELIVEKNGEKLSISNLSHGEKGMFAMIGDIARRLSLANPSLENPLEGEGIVLIDEIELHLHPGWQRKIVPQLEKTFPNIQFILTTHSPQVLSTMKRENVFILEDFKLVEETPHTYGKDSNSILYDLFGVEERPKHAKQEFKKLYKLIDDASMVKEAKAEYQKMKKKYGEFDSEILRAGMHLDFLTE